MKSIAISIVCPVYKEDKNISRVLSTINSQVTTPHEILLIYDFPEDPTVPAAKKFISQQKATNIRLIKNSIDTSRGVLNAIKTGFKVARGQAIVVMMADLSDDVSQVDEMYKLIKAGYDVVCASRWAKGGQKIGGPLMKTLLSRLAGLSLHYLFGVPTTDATNAYKMYRKRVLDRITIESTGGFEYSLEITLKAFKQGYKITEIPTVWKDRIAGTSNFKLFQWLPSYLKQYFLILKYH